MQPESIPADHLRTFAAPDGAVLTYRIWRGAANRPLLVLFHGAASNSTRWWQFVAETVLKDQWDILRPDLRGHGRSRYRGPIGMERWSDDLAALLDHEGYARAVVGGHCLGANLALHFAHRYPQRTAGLVLIEPMVPEALVGNLRTTRRLTPLFRFAIAIIRLLNHLGLYRRELPPLDLEQLDRTTRAAMAAAGDSDALTKRYASPRADLRYNPSANYLQDMVEVGRALPPLRDIRAPVLALLSTGRKFAEPEPTRSRLEALPDCTVVQIDAHHWIPTERPEEMRARIEQWFSLSLPTAATPS